MAGLAGVDGAERRGEAPEWSGVDTRQPSHFAERRERRKVTPGVPQSASGYQNDGRKPQRRSENKTTGRSAERSQNDGILGDCFFWSRMVFLVLPREW